MHIEKKYETERIFVKEKGGCDSIEKYLSFYYVVEYSSWDGFKTEVPYHFKSYQDAFEFCRYYKGAEISPEVQKCFDSINDKDVEDIESKKRLLIKRI